MSEPAVVRHYRAGMSVEALASSWARGEQAPDGAVVVLDNEISGRLRGGEPWTVGGTDGLMFAMVSRPDINPLQESLLWLPASLAAADALVAVTETDHAVLWPDRVINRQEEARRCAVNVSVQLGPGRVEHAIFAVRLDLRRLPEEALDQGALQQPAFVSTYVESARRYVELLSSDPDELLAEYAGRCAQMSERVRVKLLPRGEARGRVAGIDRDGFLVLESPTGMLERIAPASLHSIEKVLANP